jgi:hypothetical protein
MTQKFPSNVQKVLESALLHLWDKSRPEPALESLNDWLEGDGWDDVVSGLISSCIYTDRIMDDLNDECLLEYTDIADKYTITNSDRIEFARGRIEYFLSGSMYSVHSIEIDSKTMPPAKLCFTMYYHPQGGASISSLSVCHSHLDYLDECDGIIAGARELSDKDILTLWRKSEAKIKAWRKKFLK